MASTKRKVRVAYGWAGVISDSEGTFFLDLEPMSGYGVVYRTRKEARNYYQMAVRVKVVQANSKEAK